MEQNYIVWISIKVCRRSVLCQRVEMLARSSNPSTHGGMDMQHQITAGSMFASGVHKSIDKEDECSMTTESIEEVHEWPKGQKFYFELVQCAHPSSIQNTLQNTNLGGCWILRINLSLCRRCGIGELGIDQEWKKEISAWSQNMNHSIVWCDLPQHMIHHLRYNESIIEYPKTSYEVTLSLYSVILIQYKKVLWRRSICVRDMTGESYNFIILTGYEHFSR